jgi:Neuraminidase (sialidase)
MNIGKVVNDMPPRKDNGRNSEGAFYTLEDGKILFFYSRYNVNESRDDSSADIAFIESVDGGDTWSDFKVLFKNKDEKAINLMSVSTMKMNNGDLGVFYINRKKANDARLYLRRSNDGGISFGDPILCIPPEGYYVTNNDRVVHLSSGRIIIPTAFHRNGYDPSNAKKSIKFDSRGTVIFFASDDGGYTWQELDAKVVIPHSRSKSGLQEPGLVQLKNGVLWAYARTDMGYQYEMFSFNDGESWTDAEPSRFTSPCSPLSIKRNPNNGDLVAVWNPIPVYDKKLDKYSDRTPLVLSTSKDDGCTWSEYKYIEDEPNRGYCYTAMHFTKDSLLLAYCAGGKDDNGILNKLRIKKILLEDLK